MGLAPRLAEAQSPCTRSDSCLACIQHGLDFVVETAGGLQVPGSVWMPHGSRSAQAAANLLAGARHHAAVRPDIGDVRGPCSPCMCSSWCAAGLAPPFLETQPAGCRRTFMRRAGGVVSLTACFFPFQPINWRNAPCRIAPRGWAIVLQFVHVLHRDLTNFTAM